MASEDLRIEERPVLRNPVMITAFRGWNDGGQAATRAAGFLARQWDTRRFADIDPEAFVDFQAVRPMVSLDEGMTRHIEWPENAFFHGAIPGADRDAVILLGVEPNYRWRAFTDLVIGLARDLGVELVVTLGALLADVPHTKPVHLIGTATDQDLIDRYELQRSRYEGPTGIVGVLHDACGRAEIQSASLWAAVPAYASQVPSPKASLALVSRACEMLGTPAPVGSLTREAAEYESRVTAIVNDDDDLLGYVSRLESMSDLDDSDDDDEDDDDTVGGELADEPEVNSDALMAELERFLRDQQD